MVCFGKGVKFCRTSAIIKILSSDGAVALLLMNQGKFTSIMITFPPAPIVSWLWWTGNGKEDVSCLDGIMPMMSFSPRWRCRKDHLLNLKSLLSIVLYFLKSKDPYLTDMWLWKTFLRYNLTIDLYFINAKVFLLTFHTQFVTECVRYSTTPWFIV